MPKSPQRSHVSRRHFMVLSSACFTLGAAPSWAEGNGTVLDLQRDILAKNALDRFDPRQVLFVDLRRADEKPKTPIPVPFDVVRVVWPSAPTRTSLKAFYYELAALRDENTDRSIIMFCQGGVRSNWAMHLVEQVEGERQRFSHIIGGTWGNRKDPGILAAQKS